MPGWGALMIQCTYSQPHGFELLSLNSEGVRAQRQPETRQAMRSWEAELQHGQAGGGGYSCAEEAGVPCLLRTMLLCIILHVNMGIKVARTCTSLDFATTYVGGA